MIKGNVIRQVNDDGNTWVDCSEEAFKRAKANGMPVREVHLHDESFRAAFDVWQDKTNWVQKDRRFDVLKPWGMHRGDVLKAYIEHLEARIASLEDSRNDAIVALEAAEHLITKQLPPHIYRELVSELTKTAKSHCGAGSMREALSYVLSRYVKPDHQ